MRSAGRGAGRYVGRQVARENLRAIDQKFHPGATPLEREPFEGTIKPQYKDQLEQMMKLMQEYANQSDPDTQKAVALWKTQVQQGTFNDQVKFDFARRFYYWLLGRGTTEDHDRTLWGRGNAAVYNSEVRGYIEAFSSKRLQYAQQLALLASNVPTTLNGYYLYFKYIVGGNLKRAKTDSGTEFWDMTDEDYLADFEMFRMEFDKGPAPKEQWMGKPYSDGSRGPPNPTPYPAMDKQSQIDKYAVKGLSRAPGVGDPEATRLAQSAVLREQSFSRNKTVMADKAEAALATGDIVANEAVLGGGPLWSPPPTARGHRRTGEPSPSPIAKEGSHGGLDSPSATPMKSKSETEMVAPLPIIDNNNNASEEVKDRRRDVTPKNMADTSSSLSLASETSIPKLPANLERTAASLGVDASKSQTPGVTKSEPASAYTPLDSSALETTSGLDTSSKLESEIYNASERMNKASAKRHSYATQRDELREEAAKLPEGSPERKALEKQAAKANAKSTKAGHKARKWLAQYNLLSSESLKVSEHSSAFVPASPNRSGELVKPVDASSTGSFLSHEITGESIHGASGDSDAVSGESLGHSRASEHSSAAESKSNVSNLIDDEPVISVADETSTPEETYVAHSGSSDLSLSRIPYDDSFPSADESEKPKLPHKPGKRNVIFDNSADIVFKTFETQKEYDQQQLFYQTHTGLGITPTQLEPGLAAKRSFKAPKGEPYFAANVLTNHNPLTEVVKLRLPDADQEQLTLALEKAFGQVKGNWSDLANANNIAVRRDNDGTYDVKFYEGGTHKGDVPGNPAIWYMNELVQRDSKVRKNVTKRPYMHGL